jgi:hypothetical protein
VNHAAGILAAMTPSASLLQAISGLTAPKAAAPQATATRPAPVSEPGFAPAAPRDGSALPGTPDRDAPRGRYLDITA